MGTSFHQKTENQSLQKITSKASFECDGNLFLNANFLKGKKGRISGNSVPGWRPISSPRYSPTQGYDDAGFIGFWGNYNSIIPTKFEN